MNTEEIRKLIRQAEAIEKKTANLSNAIHQVAAMRGVQLRQDQHATMLKFIQEYIEHAPALLDQIALAANRAHCADEVLPILEAAEQYFLAPLDLIPDHFGLLGLVDDAYLAHSLIQALSDSYRDRTGRSLLPTDLTVANQLIRGLIGEPQATMLDAGVANVLNGPAVQQALIDVSRFGPGFNNTGPDPVWGGVSLDEYVNTQLGAMGVI